MKTYNNFLNNNTEFQKIINEFKKQPWYKELPNKPKIWDANSPVIRNLIRTLIKGGEYVEELSFGKPGTEILGEGSPTGLINAIEELSDELDANLRALRREMKYNKIISELELEDMNESFLPNHLRESLDEIRDVYNEFGIDIHSVPSNIQGQVNSLIKEIIKLRKKN